MTLPGRPVRRYRGPTPTGPTGPATGPRPPTPTGPTGPTTGPTPPTPTGPTGPRIGSGPTPTGPTGPRIGMHELVTASQYRVAGSHQSAWLTAGDASAVNGMAANANANAPSARRNCGRVVMGISFLCLIDALRSTAATHIAVRADFVTQASRLFLAPKNNGVMAKLLSDALAPGALGLNFHPYRQSHVARYPMAAVPAEADRPLVLALRASRFRSDRDPKVGEYCLRCSATAHQSSLDRRCITVVAGDVDATRRAHRTLQFKRYRHGR